MLSNSYYISMLPAYKMVVLNLILSTCLFLSLIAYKYLFKRKINLLYLLILISILPIISIFRAGTYESGGFSDYLKFAISFYNSLKEGILIPQWDSLRSAGYGSPIFMFMYILPFYIVSFFHSIGFTFIDSMKILLALSFPLSGLSMYVFIKGWFGKVPAFVASIFYLFAPYHLVDLHFRTDVGEALSFIFLPIQFLSAKKIIETGSWKWIIIGAINIILLIMSHQAISLISIFIVATYGVTLWICNKRKNIKYLWLFIFSIILGILISTFYWLPIVFEAKNIFWGNYGNVSFIKPLTMFFYSPWKLGLLFQGPNGELSFIVGYIHWIIVIFSIVLLVRSRVKGKLKSILIYLLISFAVTFLMMQEISKPIWDFIPLISKSQFSYRFLLFTSFFSAVMAGIISTVLIRSKKGKYVLISLCFIAIISTMLNWGHRRFIPSIDDAYLKKELILSSPIFEVTIPKWADYTNFTVKNKPISHIDILSGRAEIVEIFRNSIRHNYVIHAYTKTVFRENTFYFPGWNLKINNKSHKIIYDKEKYQGIITFSLPKGIYKVELAYSDTLINKISKTISLLSIFGILMYVFYKLNFFQDTFNSTKSNKRNSNISNFK